MGRSLNEINENLIANYQEMVEILKSRLEQTEKYVTLLEKQLLIQDKHIESVIKPE